MNGSMKFCIGLVAVFVIMLVIALQFAHKLENQNLAIVQSMSGDVEVRKTAGWWLQVSPTITEYPKAGIYICSAESKEHDPFTVSFKNKSTAIVNAQVGYRIDTTTDEKLIALHQAAEGNDETIWKLVVNTINTEMQKVSTTFDPSDVIGGDKFPAFVEALQSAIIHNKELLESGIDVDKFNVSGKPIPDDATAQQFAQQREADLAKRLAEAQVKKLEAETERERAEALQHTEHEKIQASAQMAKEKLDAERIKQNEIIEAEKKVALAELAKQEAEVKAKQEAEVAAIEAERMFKVAEIQKKTEAEKLEIVELEAKQKITAANARAKELELSKALDETSKAKLELELGKERVKWESIGKALATMKLPAIVNFGGNSANNQNPLDNLINMMTLEKLNNSTTIIK